MTRRVAVIGGGISGLAAAYRIVKESSESVELTLFEAGERLGGVIDTDISQGVVLEGGPDSVLRRKPEALDLIRELGLEDRVIGPNPAVRGSYIFHRGHFHDIPLGVGTGIPTRFDTLWASELLSLGEKMRLWGDTVLPRHISGDDTSLGALLRYRFGNGYVDRIAAPMLAGIYAGDINQLSCAATAPQLLAYQSQGRSLVHEYNAANPRPTTPAGAPPPIFSTLASGLGAIIQALQAAVSRQSRVVLHAPVTRVAAVDGRFEVTVADDATEVFSDVIAAVPAHGASAILKFLDPKTRQLLADIPYADLAVVGAAYRPQSITRPLDRTGFLVPRGEGVEMTAGTWVQSKWAYPNPAGLVPVRGFYGRAGQGGLLSRSDAEMLAVFRREMGYIMGVTDQPVYARVFRAPQAMPQYVVGHLSRMAAVRQALAAWPHFALTGSYFDGVGVPDCIRHANEAARRLIQLWATTAMMPG
jgi:oxygen-dependent protoporphyrinogen oxidase